MRPPLPLWGEAKKDELDKVVIKNDTLKKYFPRSYTPRQMEDVIIKLLEQHSAALMADGKNLNCICLD